MASTHGRKTSTEARHNAFAYFFVFGSEGEDQRNGTKAAIHAGYKPRAAAQQATRLLRNAHIQDLITKFEAELRKKSERTAADVKQELEKLAFAVITDVCDFGPDGVTIKNSSDLSRDQLAAVSEVVQYDTAHGRRVSVKLHSKQPALESLVKILGMYVERHQIEVTEEKARGLLRQVAKALVRTVNNKNDLAQALNLIKELEAEGDV